jgi:hypothetical protein
MPAASKYDKTKNSALTIVARRNDAVFLEPKPTQRVIIDAL